MVISVQPGRVVRVFCDAEIEAFSRVLHGERTARVGDIVHLHSLPPGLLLVVGANGEFEARALEFEAALTFGAEPMQPAGQ